MRFVLSMCITVMLGACVAPGGGGLMPQPSRTKVENSKRIDSAGQMINAYRRQHGLTPVSLNTKLSGAARQQVIDMKRAGRLSHHSASGENLKTRLHKAGYVVCYGGENVANGYRSLGQVMQAWDRSAGHREILRHPHVTEYGLVEVDGYYSLILASRC